jgi:hypothetical protein
MNDRPSPERARVLAIVSFALGVASVVCLLLFITGVPAMFLGLRSLRAINAANGRGKGRFFAMGGMVLGASATLIGLTGIVVEIVTALNARANAAVCQNNLRLIGKAVAEYHVEHETYPQGTIANARLPDPDQRLSWMVAILPFLDIPGPDTQGSAQKQNPYLGVDTNLGWEDQNNRPAIEKQVRWYLCPAFSHRHSRHDPGLTSYVGLAGLGEDAALLPLRRADMTLNPHVGFFGYDRTITIRDIERGISSTLMIGETTRANGPWAAGGKATLRGLDLDDQPCAGRGRQFGGLHPEGAYMLYVDGSIAFIRDDSDPTLLRNLVTLAIE